MWKIKGERFKIIIAVNKMKQGGRNERKNSRKEETENNRRKNVWNKDTKVVIEKSLGIVNCANDSLIGRPRLTSDV